MVVCPDCKHKNVGIVYCAKCGGELHKRSRTYSMVERITSDLDRVLSNSVYSR